MGVATASNDDEGDAPAPSAPTIRVPKVKIYVDATQLKADIRFSPSDLTNGMVEQAALFVHYGIQASLSSKQVDDLKILLENQEARIGRELRDRLTNLGEKFTEASIAGRVARDRQIIVTKRAVNEAKQVENVAKAALEAFRHRRDMLVQMGLISREEMKGEISVNRRQAQHAELESQTERQKQRFLARAAGEPDSEAA
ncbi:hypothetical protein FV222_18645 [Methylobacterium sp. WL103]|uniref:hypothetical protein n=1 Tax=Methylobacterium sp. WL103 TaxID=2603891 RepID=UPI0011CB064E|nr:hypothetical protein [Methylobacterium sp. WL103]TXM96261.1 hypothetical protein FV222_18645 [Methylobacterium sp. WL103]